MSEPAESSTSQFAATTAPPLATFDPAGAPSVISYQTPESVSYDGRHVLLTDYRLKDFAPAVSPAASGGPAGAGGAAGSPGAAPDGPAAAATTPATPLIAVPPAVVLSDSSAPGNPVVTLAPFDLTARLASLTWTDVNAATQAGKRVEVYRSLGGLLDYRIRDVTQAGSAPVQQSSVITALSRSGPAGNGTSGTGSGGEGEPGTGHPYLAIGITSPSSLSPLTGPSGGLQLPVSGTVTSGDAGPVTIAVYLLHPDGQTVAAQTSTGPVAGESGVATPWAATLPATESGIWLVAATASSIAFPSLTKAAPPVTISVSLSGPSTGPVPVPTVSITSPGQNAVIPAPDGASLTNVSFTAGTGGGSAVTVSVSADGGEAVTFAQPPGTGTSFSHIVQVELIGQGRHAITAAAVNQDGIAASPATVQVMVSPSQPARPLDRRLMIIEKIAVTSFLGNFGAGRVVKTFSLLPGEQTVISVDSYTKDDTTAKLASSILDSTASECSADFDDTVNAENDTKASTMDATKSAVAANVGASWGWGSAGLQATSTDSANSSRENMTKTVIGAVAKHTSKASSNRTVSVNTDFSQTTSAGTTTDTSRTLKNINVSRVLNFVFRQMTQEHTVFVHLLDATLGYYAADLLLDADGNPQTGPGAIRETFAEYSLPEIASFAQTQMTGTAVDTLQPGILNVLSQIPDHTGTQQSLVEQVTPKAPDGTPQPGASYLRVRPDLSQSYPATGPAQFTVPGIILGVTTCVLRTDQLLCDAVLGAGDALDSYSHALQELAIAERQAAVAASQAATAREKLAQEIVSGKDADMAAIWQKVFPRPLSVPATVTVPATTQDQSVPLA